MKTGNRILCGPVRKYQYLTGKVIGGIIVTIVQAIVVILFSKYVMNANWGTDIPTILVLVLAPIGDDHQHRHRHCVPYPQ